MNLELIRESVAVILCEIEGIPEGDELREGLRRTPERVAKSFLEFYGGYAMDPKEILSTTFGGDGLEEYKGMVVVRDIPFYSQCEHHMVPFFGTADVGYIPDARVVGISKLARLVDCFGKRLQVQERLTDQVVDAIEEHLKPKGSMCIIRAEHLCMCARGVKKPGSQTITSSIRGVFRTEEKAREEFLFLTDTRR